MEELILLCIFLGPLGCLWCNMIWYVWNWKNICYFSECCDGMFDWSNSRQEGLILNYSFRMQSIMSELSTWNTWSHCIQSKEVGREINEYSGLFFNPVCNYLSWDSATHIQSRWPCLSEAFMKYPCRLIPLDVLLVTLNAIKLKVNSKQYCRFHCYSS